MEIDTKDVNVNSYPYLIKFTLLLTQLLLSIIIPPKLNPNVTHKTTIHKLPQTSLRTTQTFTPCCSNNSSSSYSQNFQEDFTHATPLYTAFLFLRLFSLVSECILYLYNDRYETEENRTESNEFVKR